MYRKGDKVLLKLPEEWNKQYGPGVNSSMISFAHKMKGKELTIWSYNQDTVYIKIKECEGNWWYHTDWVIPAPVRSKEEQLLTKIQQLWNRQPFVKEKTSEV